MERKLAAVFHADVQGYSRLIAQDVVTTLRTVATHRDLMRTLVGDRHVRANNLLSKEFDIQVNEADLTNGSFREYPNLG